MQNNHPPRRRGAPKKTEYEKAIKVQKNLFISRQMKRLYIDETGDHHPKEDAPEGILEDWRYRCTVFWLKHFEAAEKQYFEKHYPQLL